MWQETAAPPGFRFCLCRLRGRSTRELPKHRRGHERQRQPRLAINRTRNKTAITSDSLPPFNNLAGGWAGKRRRWEGAVGKRTRCAADPMVADLREALKDLARSLFDPYRPELHYMRGPGPKWHAKHDRARRCQPVRGSRPRLGTGGILVHIR